MTSCICMRVCMCVAVVLLLYVGQVIVLCVVVYVSCMCVCGGIVCACVRVCMYVLVGGSSTGSYVCIFGLLSSSIYLGSLAFSLFAALPRVMKKRTATDSFGSLRVFRLGGGALYPGSRINKKKNIAPITPLATDCSYSIGESLQMPWAELTRARKQL